MSDSKNGSGIGPQYEALFRGCANVRLAVAMTTLTEQMRGLAMKIAGAKQRLKLIEEAVRNIPCNDSPQSDNDQSSCNERLRQLIKDRSEILSELYFAANKVAVACSDIVKDTTKASNNLLKVLKEIGIEDELHQVKGLLKDLQARETALASQALDNIAGPLDHVRREAFSLRDQAQTEADLKVFGAAGIRHVKWFVGPVIFSAACLLASFHLDPNVMADWSLKSTQMSNTVVCAIMLSLFGGVSAMFLLAPITEFYGHVRRCRKGPHPSELVADKDALAYAKALVAAAEAAAKA